mmetsp:Transcript_26354/g.86867  ORF Transcript_26354/g.86867 Transcript_26354/m.86867 type:complete len:201 (+) Transcript_26354:313-915(+)
MALPCSRRGSNACPSTRPLSPASARPWNHHEGGWANSSSDPSSLGGFLKAVVSERERLCHVAGAEAHAGLCVAAAAPAAGGSGGAAPVARRVERGVGGRNLTMADAAHQAARRRCCSRSAATRRSRMAAAAAVATKERRAHARSHRSDSASRELISAKTSASARLRAVRLHSSRRGGGDALPERPSRAVSTIMLQPTAVR